MNEYAKQARDFLVKSNATINFRFIGNNVNHCFGDKQVRPHYKITLENKNGKYTFDFWDSIHNKENKIKPTEYDVLSCLEKYDYESFENFCSMLGYERSKKSKVIYSRCVKQYESLNKLFSEEEMEVLRKIQ